MRKITLLALLMTFGLAGCRWHHHRSAERRPLSPEQSAIVSQSVRALAGRVERDVTQQGPSAWSQYFESGPEFFMVVNGQMAFASGTDALTALPSVAAQYKQITLDWGDASRIDPLAPNLAVFAAPYHESLVLAGGRQAESSGYFTGVAELRNGVWKFRDAHWSEIPAAAPPAKEKGK